MFKFQISIYYGTGIYFNILVYTIYTSRGRAVVQLASSAANVLPFRSSRFIIERWATGIQGHSEKFTEHSRMLSVFEIHSLAFNMGLKY